MLSNIYGMTDADELALLRLMVNHYFGSMLITDNKGRFLYVNDACCELLELDRDTFMQISIYDTLHDYCHATSASTIKTLETKKECLSFHTLASNQRNILALSRPYFDENEQLKYVFTYSWGERELYALLEKFDAERNNVRNILHFTQNIDHISHDFIAVSEPMQSLLAYSQNIASVDSTVIIYGESGVGKELFAKYIHANSNRASEVFIPINCASIPTSLLESELFGYEKGAFTGGMRDGKIGLFEFANKGTVFLDEIGEIPIELQAKLLRVLEAGEIKRLGSNQILKTDVRIIAATNRNLLDMVHENKFRADLYYRLNVLEVKVPPLRNRIMDIQPLAQHFLSRCNKKYGFQKFFSPALVSAMEQYTWPGNVRELKNVVERMCVSTPGSIIEVSSFGERSSIILKSEAIPSVEEEIIGYKDSMEQYERSYIQSCLKLCNGNVKAAAEKMQLHLSTLYRKMEKFHITPETSISG